MKILFDIPEKSIDMAKVILQSSCNSEKQENDIERISEKLKAYEGPVTLNFDKMDDECKQKVKELHLAISLIAIATMGLNEEETNQTN